ncbi:MAG: condensation domain-containing protein, partial [Agathobacter sp.]
EPTARLLKFCEDNHVSLQCLLIMGIRTYFQKANGNDDVSINVAYARRATIFEKKSGGTRIHSFPFRTMISEDTTFLEGVYIIRDGQNEMFRHVNYDPVEYFAHRAKTYPVEMGRTYEPMSLTYQPMTSKEQGLNKLGDIKYKTKWYPNGVTTQALYLTVMHRPEDNGLDFNFEHQIMAISKNTLDHFYYYMCRIMFKGIENPNMKIGDIIKLT